MEKEVEVEEKRRWSGVGRTQIVFGVAVQLWRGRESRKRLSLCSTCRRTFANIHATASLRKSHYFDIDTSIENVIILS